MCWQHRVRTRSGFTALCAWPWECLLLRGEGPSGSDGAEHLTQPLPRPRLPLVLPLDMIQDSAPFPVSGNEGWHRDHQAALLGLLPSWLLVIWPDFGEAEKKSDMYDNLCARLQILSPPLPHFIDPTDRCAVMARRALCPDGCRSRDPGRSVPSLTSR